MPLKVQPEKISVIIYGAKGLKPKKKGQHKFAVIFGVGSNKYRTDVVEDLFGNPSFNTESDIPVEDPRLPLVFKVTEKNEKDVLGQVTIPLNDLGNSRTNQPKMVALQPHKKCPTPEGELKLEVWISGTTMSDLEAVEEEHTKKHSITSRLQELKGKIIPSPRVSRKSMEHSDAGNNRTSTGSFFQQKGSVSCQDISGFYVQRESASHINIDNTSLSSMDSISETQEDIKRPEVTGISPKEGSVEGGTKVTIRGANLGLNKEDVVGLFICGANVLGSLEFISSSKLTCVTKSWKQCVGNVTVETQSGGKGSSLVQFTFVGSSDDHASDATSEISDLSRSSSKADLRRDSSIKSNNSEKHVVAVKKDSPSLARNLKAKSLFDLSRMPISGSKPEVTGLSPMEGPADGATRITIRGSNLGLSKSDIVRLSVCGMDCIDTLEFESSSKLVCIAGPALPGSGSIVVETQSGGRGASLVEFCFVENTEKKSWSAATISEAETWAAVPYNASEETTDISKSSSVVHDTKLRISAFDQVDSDFLGMSPQNVTPTGGQSRVPPPIVEIQPMRVENKKPGSPFHLPSWNKKSDKSGNESPQKLIIGNNTPADQSPPSEKENNYVNDQLLEERREKISELEKQLKNSDDQVRQLAQQNKLLKEENERMRRYMEEIVSRAIVSCPQILCTDNKLY